MSGGGIYFFQQLLLCFLKSQGVCRLRGKFRSLFIDLGLQVVPLYSQCLDGFIQNSGPGNYTLRGFTFYLGLLFSGDQISLQFVGQAPGFAANYCAVIPASPALRDVVAGNIQVRD